MAQESHQELDALLAALNRSAERFQALWFSFIALTLYFSITALTTTHRMLLLNEVQTLPIVNMKVPLLPFFVIAPLIYLVIHFYILLMMVLLARTARPFEKELQRVFPQSVDQERYRSLVENALFLQLLVGPRKERVGLHSVFLTIIALTTVAIAPVITLMLIQVMFLPYQDSWITTTHRVCILLDTIVVLILVRSYWRQNGNTRPFDYLSRRRPRDWNNALAASVYTLLFALWVPWVECRWRGEPLIPASSIEFPRPLSAARLNIFPDSILVSNETIVGQKKFEEVQAELTSRTEFGYVPSVSFSGRSFNGANFSGADLRFADFSGASLIGADFTGALLDKANFSSAVAYSSKFVNSKIFEASFENAELSFASFEGVDASGANFEKATLRRASFQNANLPSTNFSGADAYFASFQDTISAASYFHEGRFVGVNFEKSNLFGADFFAADLTGASFVGANIEVVNFAYSNINESFFSGDFLDQMPNLKNTQTIIDNVSNLVNVLNGLNALRAKIGRVYNVNVPPLDFTITNHWQKSDLVAENKIGRSEALISIDRAFSVGNNLSATPLGKMLNKIQVPSESYAEKRNQLISDFACGRYGAPYVARGVIRYSQYRDAYTSLTQTFQRFQRGSVSPQECAGVSGLIKMDWRRIDQILEQGPQSEDEVDSGPNEIRKITR